MTGLNIVMKYFDITFKLLGNKGRNSLTISTMDLDMGVWHTCQSLHLIALFITVFY